VNDDGLKNDKCKMKIAKSCRVVNGESAVILHFSLLIFHFAMASLPGESFTKPRQLKRPAQPRIRSMYQVRERGKLSRFFGPLTLALSPAGSVRLRTTSWRVGEGTITLPESLSFTRRTFSSAQPGGAVQLSRGNSCLPPFSRRRNQVRQRTRSTVSAELRTRPH
jgi:hypothetical protein